MRRAVFVCVCFVLSMALAGCISGVQFDVVEEFYAALGIVWLAGALVAVAGLE